MVFNEAGAPEDRTLLCTTVAHRLPPSPRRPSSSDAADQLCKMSQNCDKSKIRCCSFGFNRSPCYVLVHVTRTRVFTRPPKIARLIVFKTFVIWFALSLLLLLLTCATSVSGERDQSLYSSKRFAPAAQSTPTDSPSNPPNCPNCSIVREAIRLLTLEDIKQRILDGLGFAHGTPNVTTNRVQTNENPSVKRLAEDMSTLYSNSGEKITTHFRHNKVSTVESQNDEHLKVDSDDDNRIKTPFAVAIAKSCLDESQCKKFQNHLPLNFLFEPRLAQSKLTQAKLLFYQKALNNKFPGADSKINITIYKFDPYSNKYVPLLRKEGELSQKSQWIEIDVKESLSTHFKEKDSTNITLVILPSHDRKNLTSRLVTEIKKEEDNQYAPYIEIRIEETKNKRKKRSTHMDCTESSPKNHCCRYPLMVDFNEFKWDFIIAPKRYNAHYCTGECGYLDFSKWTHTHLVQMTKNMSKQACCGPRKMGPISMLYYNQQGNVIYGVLPGMVVERCGCY